MFNIDLLVYLRDEALEREQLNKTQGKETEFYWRGKATAFNQALSCIGRHDLIRYS